MRKIVLFCDRKDSVCEHTLNALISAVFTHVDPSDEILVAAENFAFPADFRTVSPLILASENRTLPTNDNAFSEVYTCGFHKKDTLSYSSFLSDSCVISLNRAICTLSGKRVEPFELPINGGREEAPFAWLAFILLLLLDDISPEELSAKIAFHNPSDLSHTTLANTQENEM